MILSTTSSQRENAIKTQLSVQVSLTGLSFLVRSEADSSVQYFNACDFEAGFSPADVLDALRKEIEVSRLNPETCENVKVLHGGREYTLVPSALFDERKASDYLKFNSKILPSDYIAWDQLEQPELHLVYIPLVNVNNYLFDTFGAFEYYHTSTVMLRSLKAIPQGTSPVRVFAHVQNAHFDLLVYDQNKILLCNSYPYGTAEDFIYYLLFAYEQLKLDPEINPTILLGAVDEEDALFEIAYRYIRHVELLAQPVSQPLTAGELPHQHFLLKQL